ncbi:MAG: bifunctional nuclease family protein [Candidatus Coatesbacteria bacterium]|nr:MAG: bifunctional nuclease family protein [Candidatus Coatesbacteria bacterium]
MKAEFVGIYISDDGWPRAVVVLDAGAFAISIDRPTAVSILVAARGFPKEARELKRLLLHDLMAEIISRGGLSIEKVVIDRALEIKRIDEGFVTGTIEGAGLIYSATLHGTDRDGVSFEPLTVRPSDGIAIAVRVGCDIEIADDVVPKLTLYDPNEIPFRKLSLREIDKL